MVRNLWWRLFHSAMLFGLLSAVIRVGANILLLPFVLRCLSREELALWWVFLALGAVATLADFGFGQAITRAFSFLWAGAGDFTADAGPPRGQGAPNLPRIKRLSVTARYLYWRLALGAVAVLAVFGTWFVARPEQSSIEARVLWGSWLLFLLVIAFSLGTSHWMLACQGINRVRLVQVALSVSGLVYVVAAALMLWCGTGLLAMVVAVGLRGVIVRELCRRCFRDAVGWTTGEALSPDPGMLRDLWPSVWKFGVLSVGTYLILNANVLISSRVLGDDWTASYGLTVQVGGFLGNVAALWLTVKWPEITVLRARGNTVEMATLFARRLALMMGTFAVLSVLLLVAGNALLAAKGTATRLLPAALLAVYLFYVGQQQFYIQFANLTFTENVVPFYLVSLFTGVGMCLMSWLLSRWFGIWGLVLAPLLTTAACSSWYPVWRGFRGQPFGVRQFVSVAMGGKA